VKCAKCGTRMFLDPARHAEETDSMRCWCCGNRDWADEFVPVMTMPPKEFAKAALDMSPKAVAARARALAYKKRSPEAVRRTNKAKQARMRQELMEGKRADKPQRSKPCEC
jgi:hypothetical protein